MCMWITIYAIPISSGCLFHGHHRILAQSKCVENKVKDKERMNERMNERMKTDEQN